MSKPRSNVRDSKGNPVSDVTRLRRDPDGFWIPDSDGMSIVSRVEIDGKPVKPTVRGTRDANRALNNGTKVVITWSHDEVHHVWDGKNAPGFLLCDSNSNHWKYADEVGDYPDFDWCPDCLKILKDL